jgi:hypothetical protein
MSIPKQFNFPEWRRDIIKDMDDVAKSTIEYRGRQTRPIVWRRGINQGCPLSPLIFNPCLEPLLEAIKRNEDIHGAYVQTSSDIVRFTVHASADSVAFISENPKRIGQMFQVLEHSINWSKMEVNVEKRATASYIYDEERRRTFFGRSFKFRGQKIPSMMTADSMRYPRGTNYCSKN